MPHCIRNQGLWLPTCGDTVGRRDCSLIQLYQALSKDYALTDRHPVSEHKWRTPS